MSALVEDLHRFEPSWLKVGQIYRRICFLRSEGLGDEALKIEKTEFAEAEAQARASSSGSEADSILASLMAEERERVSGAIAFAEVLVPMLAERLSHLPGGHPPAPPTRTPSRKPRLEGAGETRGIADFIDDMLAQDRPSSR